MKPAVASAAAMPFLALRPGMALTDIAVNRVFMLLHHTRIEDLRLPR